MNMSRYSFEGIIKEKASALLRAQFTHRLHKRVLSIRRCMGLRRALSLRQTLRLRPGRRASEDIVSGTLISA